MVNIAIEGLPGTGKDTLASHINRAYGHQILSFCEPLKRIVQQVYAFSDQQLFGPSKYRDMPDTRYLRADGTYLTPRIALQLFGTEAGRACYEDTWFDMATKKAHIAELNGKAWVFTDTRFEVAKIRDKTGCLCVRVTRAGVVAGTHASDAHALLPNSLFDLVLSTNGSIEATRDRFDAWYKEVSCGRKGPDQASDGQTARAARSSCGVG